MSQLKVGHFFDSLCCYGRMGLMQIIFFKRVMAGLPWEPSNLVRKRWIPLV